MCMFVCLSICCRWAAQVANKDIYIYIYIPFKAVDRCKGENSEIMRMPIFVFTHLMQSHILCLCSRRNSTLEWFCGLSSGGIIVGLRDMGWPRDLWGRDRDHIPGIERAAWLVAAIGWHWMHANFYFACQPISTAADSRRYSVHILNVVYNISVCYSIYLHTCSLSMT